MSKYYNKTSSALVAAGPAGHTFMLPSRVWVVLDDAHDGAEDLCSYVKSGRVVRRAIPAIVEIPIPVELVAPEVAEPVLEIPSKPEDEAILSVQTRPRRKKV